MSNYVEEVEGRQGDGRRDARPGRRPRSRQRVPERRSRSEAVEAGETLPDGDVGIELTRQYYLRVIAARDGSPAAKAGLQTGDYVRAIDGKPTRDMSVFEGMRLLRGAARLEGVAHGHPRQRRRSARDRRSCARSRPAPPVTGQLRRRRTSATSASPRSARTSRRTLKKQIADLSKAGATSLIVDLRRTAEGPVENGIAAARLFVKSGTLAQRERPGRRRRATKIAAKAGDGAIDTPGVAARHDGHVGRRRTLRRRARRQQARGSRSASTRSAAPASRSWSSCRRTAACGSPTPLPHARRRAAFTTRASSRRRGRRARRRVRRPGADDGSDPRRGARARQKKRRGVSCADCAACFAIVRGSLLY